MISKIQGGAATANTADSSTYIAVKAVSSTENGQEETGQTLQNTADKTNTTGTVATDSANATDGDKAGKNQTDQKNQHKLNKDDVNEITKALNKFMSNINCDLEFKYYEKIDQLSVKLVDQKTNEVIKEFPPEDIMKAMIKTKEWIGVLLDKKA